MDNDIKICEYDNCQNKINKPYDNNYCIFHAPKAQKGISNDEFNDLIFKKVNEEDYNFEGYIFPGEIQFRKNISFTKKANFNSALFLGDISFAGIKFYDIASFRKAKFNGHSKFLNTKFISVADFFSSHFARDTDFFSAQFNLATNFISAQFEGNTNFSSAQFLNDIDFHSALFFGDISFKSAQFYGHTDFSSVKFFKDVYFVENEIKTKMEFNNIFFSNDSLFYFQNPILSSEQNQEILIIFQNVHFISFRTFFENISDKGSKTLLAPTPAILLRYCHLKDIYFSNNSMSLFSFYKSSFEEARFISNEWQEKKETILKIPFSRKNIIFEEYFYSTNCHNDDKKNEINQKYLLTDLKNYKEIASFYQRMKVALDRTKDYQEAGRFYFNEYEMKRLDLKMRLKNSFPLNKILKLLPYNLYKILAGYGEKPQWSFFWFLLFSIIFSIIHLFNGIKIFNVDINYDFSITKQGLQILFSMEFWNHLSQSLIFTLYNIFPFDYWPSLVNKASFVVQNSLLLSFLNTIVLDIMIVFILVGLKRKFRRF